MRLFMNQPQTNFPDQQQVAVLAYLIWEKEGRPRGRAFAHWIQAQKQLEADYQHELTLLRKKQGAKKSR